MRDSRFQKKSLSRWNFLGFVGACLICTLGCQAWQGMGVPFSSSRVPPPSTGSYGTTSQYYKNSANNQAFQPQAGFGSGLAASDSSATGQTGGFSGEFSDGSVMPASASISSDSDSGAVSSAVFTDSVNEEVPSLQWQQ